LRKTENGKYVAHYDSCPILRIHLSRYGMAFSEGEETFWLIRDADIDISADLKHWIHLVGDRCRFNLPLLH
jgi:hypothetical protein